MDANGTDGTMRGGKRPERIELVLTMATPAIAPPAQSSFEPGTRLRFQPTTSEASEREQLLDRLQSLRRALPVLAQEMAAARRQAARLRSDNRKLAEQVRRLRATLEERERKAL
jgi:hypothetical protein